MLQENQYTSAGIELLRDFPPSSTNTAVQFFNTSNGKTVHLVVKRKFVRPTDETSDIETVCLVAPEYEQIVMVGAVADINRCYRYRCLNTRIYYRETSC
jgi:hypothetical protein